MRLAEIREDDELVRAGRIKKTLPSSGVPKRRICSSSRRAWRHMLKQAEIR